MENIRAMVMDYINVNVEYMVESHLECWATRYENYSTEDLVWDLQVNHDFSSEYEWVEEVLEVEMNDEEKEYLDDQFIKEAKSQFISCDEKEEIEENLSIINGLLEEKGIDNNTECSYHEGEYYILHIHPNNNASPEFRSSDIDEIMEYLNRN